MMFKAVSLIKMMQIMTKEEEKQYAQAYLIV